MLKNNPDVKEFVSAFCSKSQ